jgi:hypothetical protein
MHGPGWFPYPRADMVRWYSPLQLLQTGSRVAFSTLLGGEFDRRQIDPRIAETYAHFDLSVRQGEHGATVPRDELVFDYIADTGDGWNSTYAVAYTATRAALDVKDPTGVSHHLRRGELLVFGGDEVYPTPSRALYEQRLVMPYHTAMGWTETDHPVVFAIPGNHDWYDNLTAFSHLFLDKQWFCGWKLAQRRSYFAIKLPHDWWLIGIDTQFGEDIDATQVAYFEGIAAAMTPASKIILCTAEPVWVREHEVSDPLARERRRRESNLVFLEDRVFERARIKVNLSGDYHHYRRHASDDDRRQKITAGNGGAFLHPTHTFKKDALPGDLALRHAYPDHATSWRLAWHNLAFIYKNPSFGGLTGLLYLLVGWNIIGGLTAYQLGDMFSTVEETLLVILRSPSSVTTIVLALAGFVLFTDTHKTWYRIFGGLSHASLHLGAAITIGWLMGHVAHTAGWQFNGLAHLGLTLVALFVGGWLIGSLLMGLYLLTSVNIFGRHSTESFSSIAIQDYKLFLRLHINRAGELVIHPIGLDRVPRRWRDVPNAARDAARVLPDDPDVRCTPRLVEPPIVVRP